MCRLCLRTNGSRNDTDLGAPPLSQKTKHTSGIPQRFNFSFSCFCLSCDASFPVGIFGSDPSIICHEAAADLQVELCICDPRPRTASTPLRDTCTYPCKFIYLISTPQPPGVSFRKQLPVANRWQFQAATCMQNIVQLLNNSSAPCYKLQLQKKSNNRSRLQLGHSDNSASCPDILAYPMIRTGQCNCVTRREKL